MERNDSENIYHSPRLLTRSIITLTHSLSADSVGNSPEWFQVIGKLKTCTNPTIQSLLRTPRLRYRQPFKNKVATTGSFIHMAGLNRGKWLNSSISLPPHLVPE